VGRSIHLDFGAVPAPILVSQMRARVFASDRGVAFAPHSPGNNIAVIQLNPSNWQDPAHLERMAQADLLMVTAHELWAGSALANVPVIASLKAINPDLKVVGYVSAFTSRLSGAIQPARFVLAAMVHALAALLGLHHGRRHVDDVAGRRCGQHAQPGLPAGHGRDHRRVPAELAEPV
jgi:hypothetical protein